MLLLFSSGPTNKLYNKIIKNYKTITEPKNDYYIFEEIWFFDDFLDFKNI